jgi:hypothetical protein
VVEDDWKQVRIFYAVTQSKSFANNIILFLMADIVLECHLGKSD